MNSKDRRTQKFAEDIFASGVRGQETVAMDLQFGGVECTAAEDMARQEYALSSDLKYQIQRFGVGHHVVSGELDFDNLDLTRALALVEESSQAWLQLPKVLRDRYQSWTAIEQAHQSGELAQVLKAAGIDGGSLPSVSDASPSDSAADGGANA